MSWQRTKKSHKVQIFGKQIRKKDKGRWHDRLEHTKKYLQNFRIGLNHVMGKAEDDLTRAIRQGLRFTHPDFCLKQHNVYHQYMKRLWLDEKEEMIVDGDKKKANWRGGSN